MKINKHIFVNEKCIICGALSFPKLQQRYRDNNQTPPTTDERTCRDREDGVNVRDLRPEPTARSIAAEDSDTISRRIAEIEKERLEAVNKPELAQTAAAPVEQEYDSLYGLYWRPGMDKVKYLSEKSIG